MCDPVTASLVLTGVTAGVQFNAARQQASHTKAVGRFNARVAENKATEVRNVGIEQENQARQEARQLQSRQRAVLASRGVQVDEGSALALQEDTKLIGDINALRIRRNTEGQAQALELGSQLTTSAAGARSSALRQQGTAALIGGAGRVASQWYQFSNTPTTTDQFNFDPNQFVN